MISKCKKQSIQKCKQKAEQTTFMKFELQIVDNKQDKKNRTNVNKNS